MLIFLSKGKLHMKCGEKIDVLRGERHIGLGGICASLWLDGNGEFMTVSGGQQEKVLRSLEKIGLVAFDECPDADARYRILSHCIFKVSEQDRADSIQGMEREIYIWLKDAGLSLSAAELIRLYEQGAHPNEELLGKENIYRLVMEIYSSVLSSDNRLEFMMNHAESRDGVVDALLKLLKKGYIEIV